MEGKSALSSYRDLPGGRRTLDVDTMALQNGFIDVAVPLSSNIRFPFRAGRQELLFGKQRLVSPLDWANTRRTFDGFSGIFHIDTWSVTGFCTRAVPVQKYDFNDQDANTDFYGIYATGQLSDSALAMDLYWLGLERDTAAFNGTAGDERRQTLGGRVGGKLGDSGLDADLEGAYQFGALGSADISAFMLATEVGYTVAACPTSPRLHLGISYASGDNSPGGDVETFNQLFPLGHAYLGWIDLVGRQNVFDLTPGLTLKPFKQMTLKLNGHLFWRSDRADALYNAGGAVVRPGSAGTGSEVGSEVDLLAKYQFDRGL